MLDVKNLVGYIITNEGNLIISQAKLSDTGEGKCQSRILKLDPLLAVATRHLDSPSYSTFWNEAQK